MKNSILKTIRSFIKRITNKSFRLRIRYSYNYCRGYFYYGKEYYCVCCDRFFKKFLPFGNIERKNAKCPNCESLERTRVLQYYLKDNTDIFNRDKYILHFAPERMLSKNLKKASENYISVDIEKGAADRVEDIQNLGFKNSTFDYIICSCVLGHVEDEDKAINEIYRVLKVGGKAFILTVIDLKNPFTFENVNIVSETERLKFYGEKDLLRLHGKDFFNRLRRSNSSVKEIDFAQTFNLSDRNRFSLGNGERELIFEIEKFN